MKRNPLKQGMLIENAVGIGTVTEAMVMKRAKELAEIDDRSPNEISKSDWETAKRELTGKEEIGPEDAILESATESDRWNMVPGSMGTRMPESPSEDEDDEGRIDSEVLFEEGISEAEHDQMLQAARTRKPD